MLVLTRRIGEKINIGDNIAITVLGQHGKQIRFGLDAPKEIAIHREEVYKRIQRENKK